MAAIAGKKDGMKQGALGGVLKELGYTEDQVCPDVPSKMPVTDLIDLSLLYRFLSSRVSSSYICTPCVCSTNLFVVQLSA